MTTGRTIARYSQGKPGPTVVLLCGIHGNENSGVFAAYDVITELAKNSTELRGSISAIAGNLPALKLNTRYIDLDLNRIWSAKRLKQLRRGERYGGDKFSEFKEQEEIFDIIKKQCVEASGPMYMIDLHTTSASSIPFIFISDTIRNREFTRSIPLPVILGVEEMLNSTLLNFANHLGIVCYGLEAGSHYSPSSYHNTVSAIWITLAESECIEESSIPEMDNHRSSLKSSASATDRYFHLSYRYDISRNENFTMKPGFINFETVKKGQHIAYSSDREILSPLNGLILMPLYQDKGNDGFYIIKEINPFWIKISAFLRKLKSEKILRLIPGIHNVGRIENRFAARNSALNNFIVDLLHLLGYKRTRNMFNLIIFTRREYDLEPPDNYTDFFRKVI